MQNTATTEKERVPILSTVEDTLLDLQRLQMQKAIKTIQEASVKSGKSNMTLEEINAEIAATRVERRAREKNR